MSTGFANVRKALTSGALGELPRGARRGVQAYYNLEGSRETRMEEYRALRDDLQEVLRHPELLQDRLAVTSAPIQEIDREVGQQFMVTNIVAAHHLAKHLPPVPKDPLTGLDMDVPITESQMDAFIRRYRVIEDPVSILDRFAQGLLTIEEVETVREVYPNLHANMVAEIAGLVAEIGSDKISYQGKVQVSLMFGFAADPTLEPLFGLAMQNNGAQTTQQSLTISGPSSPSNSPLVTNTLTRTQAVLNDTLN